VAGREEPERGGERLQKVLSRAGVASRRAAERMILAGRVRVNGEVVRSLGVRVDPARDRVEVDGVRVEERPVEWILMHKPPGVLTTRRDPHGGRTVYDLLPEELRALPYVGRLDRDTEGLLLLTNDGEASRRLQHPSFSVEREYEVEVARRPGREVLERLRRGVELEDGPARAWRVGVLEEGEGRTTLRLVLREGRKREVRRMMEAVGHRVLRLRRVRFGPVRLGDLRPGGWRRLTEHEIRTLRETVRLEETR